MGIITRLGLHDPSVWPVTAICAVPVVLCVYTCARYLSSSPEVCVDKSNPEPNRRLTLEDVKDNRFDFFRRFRFSKMQLFPNLNEKMSRPEGHESASPEEYATCRGLFRNHGLSFVDGVASTGVRA